jgi:hypothetical protein
VKAVRALRSWVGLLALAGAGAAAAPAAEHPLRVSEDGRHLVQADGRPFLYLADTAWQLFHRLSREAAGRYLEDRAAKGFTVVQAVVLAELDGLETPNGERARPHRQRPSPAGPRLL